MAARLTAIVVGVAVGAIAAFAFLSYGFYEALDSVTDGYLRAFVTKAIPPLAASFAGAVAAYSFSVYKDRQATAKIQIAAGNTAIFTLHHMYTVLSTLRDRYINPHRTDANRWLTMDTPAPGLMQNITFDVDSLVFFLNHPSKDSPAAQVLSDLLFLGEQFRMIVALIDRRGTTIGEEVLPALRAMTLPSPANPPAAIATFQPNLHRRLVTLTDEIVSRVDSGITELDHMYPRLQSALRLLHPKGNFMELNFATRGPSP